MRFLFADDHALFRRALIGLVQEMDPKIECIEAGDYLEALNVAAREARLDLVLLDLKMPGMAELAGLRSLRHRLPSVPIVVISATDDRRRAVEAIEAGAMGYVTKGSEPEKIREAIQRVLDGGIFLPLDLLNDIDPRPGEGGEGDPSALPYRQRATGQETVLGLTPRQLEVLALIGQGNANKQIAYRLGVSEGTVKMHVNAILKALGVHNRTAAVIKAEKLGLRLGQIN